jgi:hypothetical protein
VPGARERTTMDSHFAVDARAPVAVGLCPADSAARTSCDRSWSSVAVRTAWPLIPARATSLSLVPDEVVSRVDAAFVGHPWRSSRRHVDGVFEPTNRDAGLNVSRETSGLSRPSGGGLMGSGTKVALDATGAAGPVEH